MSFTKHHRWASVNRVWLLIKWMGRKCASASVNRVWFLINWMVRKCNSASVDRIGYGFLINWMDCMVRKCNSASVDRIGYGFRSTGWTVWSASAIVQV